MTLLSLASLINSLCIFLLGCFIFAGDRKKSSNQNFLFMSASIALWSFGYSIWLLQTDVQNALFWSRILSLGATLVPLSFLLWILGFLNLTDKRKELVYFSLALTAFFCFMNFSPIYIESIGQEGGFQFWQKAGPLYIYFIVFGYFGLIGWGICELIAAAAKEKDETKVKQIQLIILAAVVVSIAGASNFLLMYDIDAIPPLAQPFSIFYPFVFLFATAKYRLFNVKLIMTEFLVGLMGAIVIVLPFLLADSLFRGLSVFLLLLFCLTASILIRAVARESRAKETLEKEVQARTKELKESNDQLEKFYQLAIGRELKMIDLQKELDAFKARRRETDAK